MHTAKALAFCILLLLSTSNTQGGPMTVGMCYAVCAAAAVSCFAVAGATFGTVPGAVIAASPALVACNTAFSVCEAACVTALIAPTP